MASAYHSAWHIAGTQEVVVKQMEAGVSTSALMTCSGAPLPAGKMPGSRPGRDGGSRTTQTSGFTPFSISHAHWRLNFKDLQDRRQKKASSIFLDLRLKVLYYLSPPTELVYSSFGT